ncbi:MAG: hypothetical protein LBI72_10070 [Flavobacteriaceae bacterium]|jgi:antitoxin component YwqK of YwqJK toxin-antitoxin module|nr:hypothetical protein [Flavobacteriaceae bacterium]
MNKTIFSLAVLFSTSMFGQVVRDTIWQDKISYPTTKDQAAQFTVYSTAKNKKLADIEVFNLKSKQLILKGKGTKGNYDMPSFEGEAVNYDKKGKKASTSTFLDGTLTKMISIHPITGEQYTMDFQGGSPYNGEVVQTYENSYIYINVEDGVYNDYYIFNTINPKSKLVYVFDENNYITKEEYYDAKGVLKYTAIYADNTIQSGQSITLNYGTGSISTITEYANGTSTKSTDYYADGKVRATRTTKGDTTTTTYFDPKGKQLSVYKSRYNDTTYESYEDGTAYFYSDDSETPDFLSQILVYKENVLIRQDDYSIDGDKNYVRSISSYKDSYPTKIEYFNADGSVKSVLTYVENSYTPKEGTSYEGNTTAVYKNGVVVNKTTTYPNGKVFEKATDKLSIFYDKKGKELGRVTYKVDEYNSLLPVNGSIFTLEGDNLYGETRYEKEQTVYDSYYNTSNSKNMITSENFYKGGALSKSVKYYDNGVKKQEEIYSTASYSYDPTTINYFDKAGKAVGTYDGVKQTGTKYDYFDEDTIKSIAKYKEGEITYLKQYQTDYSNWETQTKAKYYLQAEIDYAKQGKFYDKEGKLLSTATYKNGKPFAGKVFEVDDYSSTEVTYKNGMKEGVETVTSATDGEISQKNYYTKGQKTKEEYFNNGTLLKVYPYVNDVIHGDVTFYDTEGDVLSTLTYEDGVPMNGVSMTADYEHTTKETYENGIIVSKIIYTYEDYKTLMEETYVDETTVERKVFNEDGTSLFTYQVRNGNIHGTYKYFEKNKVKYQAQLEDGKLISGTIMLAELATDSYSYETPTTYTLLTASSKSIKVQKFDRTTNKSVFQMDTKIKKGEAKDSPLLSKAIQSSNLYPINQFNSDYAAYAAYDAY